MNHWLVKQEPDTYSWDRFVRDKGTAWTGVRNFQARNNLRGMRKGDEGFLLPQCDRKVGGRNCLRSPRSLQGPDGRGW